MAAARPLPGELGRVARPRRHARRLRRGARRRRHGAVSRSCRGARDRCWPACDVVLKPTREANPWGRDILEGSPSGKPVISVGRYDRFVETGQDRLSAGRNTPPKALPTPAGARRRPFADPRLGANARARIAANCATDRPALQICVALWRQRLRATQEDRAHELTSGRRAYVLARGLRGLDRGAAQRGYETCGYADVDPGARHFILRHDVDFSLDAAVQHGREEAGSALPRPILCCCAPSSTTRCRARGSRRYTASRGRATPSGCISMPRSILRTGRAREARWPMSAGCWRP